MATKKRTGRFFVTGLVLVMLVSAVICGCGPGESEATDGGVLKIGVLKDNAALGDPTKIPTGLWLTSPCTEALFYLDGKGEIQPWLATGWDEDREAKTMTLTLREGVKFHDGSDFNAEVVKYNLERILEIQWPFITAIDTIDVVDEHTVQFNLSEWDSTLLGTLAIYPGVMVSKEAMEENGPEWSATHPVGTGPFKFVSWDRDVKIVYERNEDYWGGAPKLEGIEFSIIADPVTNLASFKRGDVDAIIEVSPKNASDLEKEGGYNITMGQSRFNFYTLAGDAMNPDSPFANVKVRQAVSHAVNTEEICETLGYGYWTSTNQPMYHAWKGYNSDIEGYPYDPERAKELLAEAGYPDGFETTIYSSEAYISSDVVTAVQGYLADVGIDAKIDLSEGGKFQGYLFDGWPEGLITTSYGLRENPILLFKLQYRTSSLAWPSQLRHSKIDELTEKAMATNDPDVEEANGKELLSYIIDEQCVFTPLIIDRPIIAMRSNFKDEGLFDLGSGGQYFKWHECYLEQ